MDQETNFYLLQADKFNHGLSRKEHLQRIYPNLSWKKIIQLRITAYNQDRIIFYLKENVTRLSALGFRTIAEAHLKRYERETYPELFSDE